MVTTDDLERIISEMEDIAANGQKPYDPRMPDSLAKLSEWNRQWAAQNKRTVSCNICGERWPESYTHYVHICPMGGL
jgi:hypothetical protein